MPKVKVETVQPVLLNKTDLCKSLGISTQAFDKWGVKPHKKDGRSQMYTVADVVANRVGNERDKHKVIADGDEEQPDNIDYQRYRLTKAQADGQELKNEKENKQVVDTEFNTFVLSKIVAQISPQLDKIPMGVKKKNPDLPQHVIDAIKAEVIKNQNIIADFSTVIEGLLDEYLSLSDS